MKKYFGLAAMTLSVFSAASLPSSADANCYVNSALPIRMTSNSAGYAVLYFRPHIINPNATGPNTIVTMIPSLYNYYWTAEIATSTPAGAAIASVAANAISNQTNIMLYGDTSTCPAINTNGKIGKVTVIGINP